MARNPITVTRALAQKLNAGPNAEAEKALKASQKSERAAKAIQEQNAGWRFTKNPKALDRIDREIKAHMAESKKQHDRYLALKAKAQNKPPPKQEAPPEKIKSRGEFFAERDAVTNKSKPKGTPSQESGFRNRLKAPGPISEAALAQHEKDMADHGLQAQRDKTARAKFNQLDIAKLPKGGALTEDEQQALKVADAMINKGAGKGKKNETRVVGDRGGDKPKLPPTGRMDQDTRDKNPIPPDPRKGPGGTKTDTRTVGPKLPTRTPGYGPGPGGIVLPKPKLPPTGTAGNSGKIDSKSGDAAFEAQKARDKTLRDAKRAEKDKLQPDRIGRKRPIDNTVARPQGGSPSGPQYQGPIPPVEKHKFVPKNPSGLKLPGTEEERQAAADKAILNRKPGTPISKLIKRYK